MSFFLQVSLLYHCRRWQRSPEKRCTPLRRSIGFTGFIQCCNVTNSIVPFSPFQGFFVGATSLVLQQRLSQLLHVLHMQPSSRTFWLMVLSVNSINSVHLLCSRKAECGKEHVREVGWCSLWGRKQIVSLASYVQQEPSPSISPWLQ